MKKALILLLTCSLSLSSCSLISNTETTQEASTSEKTSISQEVETSSPTEASSEAKTSTSTSAEESTLALEDYFPYLDTEERFYEGTGIEFASFYLYPDYYDKDAKRIQIRTNNSATEVVRVLALEDGKMVVKLNRPENYFRDNLLDADDGEEEVLLQEPLEVGTTWDVTDGKRTISSVDEKLDTIYGELSCIVVETKSNKDNYYSKMYLAPEYGLVKFEDGASDGSYTNISELKTVSKEPFDLSIVVFYPNYVDDGFIQEEKHLALKTNDITRLKIQELLKEGSSTSDTPGFLTKDTKINHLYKGDDGIAYVDFSKELYENSRNLGSGPEALFLQCIVNTIGNYYLTDSVYLTVEGQPYKSGHVEMEKGQLFTVQTFE